MVIFYSDNIENGLCHLDKNDSTHCVRVLRHVEGDEICIIDGEGTLMKCSLEEASPKHAVAKIISSINNWHSHDYDLTMAVCPTKNNDRFEWFIEKATELGVDTIVPVIGEHSERRVYKTERGRKIALSATKQSLKAKLPDVLETISVSSFLKNSNVLEQPEGEVGNEAEVKPEGELKLIAHCWDDAEFDEKLSKKSIMQTLREYKGNKISILIGPEGDFSKKEVIEAYSNGYIPIHIGESRLRTETAALTAVEAVYLSYIK